MAKNYNFLEITRCLGTLGGLFGCFLWNLYAFQLSFCCVSRGFVGKSRRKSLFLTIVATDFKDAACDIGKVNDIDLKTSGGYYSINLSVVSEQRDIPVFRGVHSEMA